MTCSCSFGLEMQHKHTKEFSNEHSNLGCNIKGKSKYKCFEFLTQNLELINLIFTSTFLKPFVKLSMPTEH